MGYQDCTQNLKYSEQKSQEGGKKEMLKIVSVNVRGLRNKTKRLRVFNWLKDKQADIVYLQETYSCRTDTEQWKNEWNWDIYLSNGTTNSRGTAILIKKGINTEIKEFISDPEGRYVFLKGSFNEKKIALLNYYGPTKDKPQQQIEALDNIKPIINDNMDQLIWGGDMNTTLDPWLDKQGGRHEQKTNFAKHMNELLEQHDLIDIWRVLNPPKKSYTWKQNSNKGIIQSRLDYWFIANNLVYDVDNSEIQNALYSDHNPITLDMFNRDKDKPGRGFWKLNVSLLKEKAYIDKINEKIDECTDRYVRLNNKGLLWDAVKAEIRGVTISYATHKAREKRITVANLDKELAELKKKLTIKADEDTMMQINTLKKELEQINNETTKGIIVRAKCKILNEYEKSSKFFLNLEKANAKTKAISCLHVDGGNIVTEPKAILEEERKFYSTLYTEKETANAVDKDEAKQYFLNRKDLNTVNEDDKELLESEVSYNEICNAIKELPNGKTPGSDGIPIDFYKVFWTKISKMVEDSINYGIKEKNLSLEQKRAVLSLLPKQGKDIRLLKNWRPISLLNSDYKILAKIVAIRLLTVIPYVINNDQAGCIKGRVIFNNIRSMTDIINYVNERNLHGILAFVDYEKAFDSVSWKYMYDCLNALNFGENFINFIKTMYSNIETCVVNNGHSSAFFKPSRGIRQGCPASALIYILLVETMANAIRNNNRIKGITINKKMYKISQYADDTCLFISDQFSLSVAMLVLDKFYKCSGLKMNKDKSEAVWIGASSNYRHTPCNLKWTTDSVKCLGILINKDPTTMIKQNCEAKLIKIEAIKDTWLYRKLSIKVK
jgi:exonuclease III